jgi:arsenite-transporting ATPase
MTSIDWYVRKRFKLDRALVKLTRPIANRVTGYQLPEDGYFDTLKGIFEQLDGVDDLLRDPEVTTVRLVTNAEKMVVRETQRAYTYFCMYGVTTDSIIVNRLIPTAENDGYFSQWAKTHAAYAAQIEEYFAPIPVLKVPLFADEVIGMERLGQVGESLFHGEDPAKRFVDRPPFSFDKIKDTYRLTMALPFVEKGDVDLVRMEQDLIVRIGAFKRHVTLPRSLVQFKQTQARMEGANLTIDFVL